MANDEQRSPWLPVQPDRPELDGTGSPGAPSFDDLIGLSPGPTRHSRRAGAPAPAEHDQTQWRAPMPESPFVVDRAPESSPSASPAAPSLAPPSATASSPTADAPAAEAAPHVPVRSPYLSAERPRPQYGAFAPPEQPVSVEEAWGNDRRAVPPVAPEAARATGSIPTIHPAVEPPYATSMPVQPVAQPAVQPVAQPAQPAALPQSVPYAPWTGAIPVVTPAPAPAPAPASWQQAPVTASAIMPSNEPIIKPDLEWNREPSYHVPTPIEAEDADVDIVAPMPAPSAAEIQPWSGDRGEAWGAFGPASEAHAPSRPPMPTRDFTPDATDPVKQLAASALSAASFEAAGAPTPRAGIPLVGSPAIELPSFGEHEPFVPRFEPAGGLTQAPVPTVSFAAPQYGPGSFAQGDVERRLEAPVARAAAAPEPYGSEPLASQPPSREPYFLEPYAPAANDPRRPAPLADAASPLSDVAVPQSEGPAYMPMVDLGGADLAAAAGGRQDAATRAALAGTDASALPSAYAPPSRPWAPVDPSEVEFVTGEHLGPETGTFESKYAGPAVAPGVALGDVQPATTGAPPAELREVPLPVVALGEPHPTAPPVTPVASFFAATAARSGRAGEPITGESVHGAEDEGVHDGAGQVPGRTAWESTVVPPVLSPPEAPMEVPRRDATRSEPLHTTATAYTPSPGAWDVSRTSGLPAQSAPPQSAPIARFPAFADASAPPTVRSAPTSVFGVPTTEEHLVGDHLMKDEGGDVPQLEGTASVAAQAKGRRRGRTALWIVLVALLAAGAAVVAYRLYFVPEPIILPVPTVTAAAPTATAAPVAITEATDFVAAMPTTVGTNVLVAYSVIDPVGDETLPARAAEHVTLSYGPSTGETVFTVEAYQHYTVEEAQQAYAFYADGVTDVEDVIVDGETVGERALVDAGADQSVVWRNNTAVFVLTGPADESLAFFSRFGI